MAYLLIIDDDEDFATAIAEVLRRDGHDVHIELDTRSAAAAMQRHPPDLVILDVMFPEDASAGFRLARAMRHHMDALKRVPVLMVTAVNTRFPLGFTSHDIDDAWLPVDAFLEKPVDLDVLLSKVYEMLGAGSAP